MLSGALTRHRHTKCESLKLHNSHRGQTKRDMGGKFYSGNICKIKMVDL